MEEGDFQIRNHNCLKNKKAPILQENTHTLENIISLPETETNYF
jgi:hypothetical protein